MAIPLIQFFATAIGLNAVVAGFKAGVRQFDSEKRRRMQQALDVVAEEIERILRSGQPLAVRTGRTSRSIKTDVFQDGKDVAGEVGPEGAGFVLRFSEDGTSNQGPQPVLDPALTRTIDQVEQILEQDVEAIVASGGARIR